MTNEQAIKWLKAYIQDTPFQMEQYERAFEMAIQALSQEPCELLIIKSDILLHQDDRKKWVESIKREKESGVIILPPYFEPLLVPNDIEINIEQEPCDDVVSREWLMRKATERFYTTNYFNHISAMIEEAPSVTQKLGWIPVSERLPEDEQEILFSTKTGRVHSGKYHDDDSANQWYSHKDKCRAWNNVVSAWMPLPKPYEPQERSDKE